MFLVIAVAGVYRSTMTPPAADAVVEELLVAFAAFADACSLACGTSGSGNAINGV